jgi:hypothetical protein
MRALLALFRDIVLCRRGPEELPVSRGLLTTLLAMYAAGNFVQARLSGWTLRGVAPLVIVEIVMLLAWVWALLVFFGKRPRFTQTMSAVIGIALVLTLLDIALLVVDSLVGVPNAVSDGWSVIRLFIMVLLIGRVLMLAIEGGMLTGFAFTMMMILSIIYVGQLFRPGIG